MHNQQEQLSRMIIEIKETVLKYTDNPAGITVNLEKSEKTGKMQIVIRLKNESEMKIEFSQDCN